MSDPEPLLLPETGIARLDDGSEAVNVGPIVAALRFLTEGRGDDRGVDETGAPLPDLLSLAFDVVRSIILGGRHADYFRQVKRELDLRAEGDTSLGLAKQAVRHTLPTAALKKAGLELQGRVRKLEEAVTAVMTELDMLTAPSDQAKKSRRKRASRPRPAPSRERVINPERVTKPAKRKPRIQTRKSRVEEQAKTNERARAGKKAQSEQHARTGKKAHPRKEAGPRKKARQKRR